MKNYIPPVLRLIAWISMGVVINKLTNTIDTLWTQVDTLQRDLIALDSKRCSQCRGIDGHKVNCEQELKDRGLGWPVQKSDIVSRDVPAWVDDPSAGYSQVSRG